MNITKTAWHYKFISKYIKVAEEPTRLNYIRCFVLAVFLCIIRASLYGFFAFFIFHPFITMFFHQLYDIPVYPSQSPLLYELMISLSILVVFTGVFNASSFFILITKQRDQLKNDVIALHMVIYRLQELLNNTKNDQQELLHYKEQCDILTMKLEELNNSEIDDLK